VDVDKLFADAVANYDDSQVVLLGVPFDGTSSHREGSRLGPIAIRRESYNFETWLPKYGFDIETAKIYDMGNTQKFSSAQDLVTYLPGIIKEIVVEGKFLITMGGEHTLTVPIVKAHKELEDAKEFGVVIFDAHMDFRDIYQDEKYCHACVTRRLAELIGANKIVTIGTRSYSASEADAAKAENLRFYESEVVDKRSIKEIVEEALKYLDTDRIYLSLDMDVIDPAYAPGVGNPEFFGLNPWQIREGFELLAPYLFGVDIVEVAPTFDLGNTAALAAQFIHTTISQVLKSK
jgi:agmatinase